MTTEQILLSNVIKQIPKVKPYQEAVGVKDAREIFGYNQAVIQMDLFKRNLELELEASKKI